MAARLLFANSESWVHVETAAAKYWIWTEMRFIVLFDRRSSNVNMFWLLSVLLLLLLVLLLLLAVLVVLLLLLLLVVLLLL